MGVGELERRVQQVLSSLDLTVDDRAIINFYLNGLKQYTDASGLRDYVHSLRVGLYCDELTLDEPAQFRREAVPGGLLHDVGKMLLPKELLRTGPMPKWERDLLRPHAASGYGLLRDTNLVWAAAAGNHHWHSGRGYGIALEDMGLSCEQQSIASRIAPLVTLADCFEAYHGRNDGRFGETHTPAGFLGVLEELHIIPRHDLLCVLYAQHAPS